MTINNNFLLAKNINFPVLISENILHESLYRGLNKEIDILHLSERTNNFGQFGRENVVLKPKDLPYLNEEYPCLRDLIISLDSKEFRGYFLKMFKKHELSKDYNLDDKIFSSSLELNVSISKDGYENPYHVDTRKRLVHGLIYFDRDSFEGGDFSVCNTKKMADSMYPQIVHNSQITSEYKIDVSDNLGLIVLSTPNSYHKGNKTFGRRKFIYFAYNMEDSKFWSQHSSWKYPLSFNEGIFYQNIKFRIFANLYIKLIKLKKIIVSIFKS